MTMTKFLQIASSTDRFGELDGDGGERGRGADNFYSTVSLADNLPPRAVLFGKFGPLGNFPLNISKIGSVT